MHVSDRIFTLNRNSFRLRFIHETIGQHSHTKNAEKLFLHRSSRIEGTKGTLQLLEYLVMMWFSIYGSRVFFFRLPLNVLGSSNGPLVDELCF